MLSVALRLLQQTTELCTRRFSGGYRNELRAEHETTRRIHQRYAVKVSIALRSHGHAVKAKYDPGFVDLKLLRMEHTKTVPRTPNKIICALELRYAATTSCPFIM